MRQSLPNIVITGFMGTGKTTVGKEVAQRLSKKFYDFDQIIEERMKISIKEIFEKYGEIFFRDIESKIVIEFVSKTDVVIATGGGTLLFNNNYSILSENSIIFCLTAQNNTIKNFNSYEVRIEKGYLSKTGLWIKEQISPSQVFVLTNPKVYKLYYEKLRDSISREGLRITPIKIPDGERFKNLISLKKVYD